MPKLQTTLDRFARQPGNTRGNKGKITKKKTFRTKNLGGNPMRWPKSINSWRFWRKKKNSKLHCSLISRERFEVTECPKNLTFQDIPTALFDSERKRWKFHLKDYNLVVSKLRRMKVAFVPLPDVVLNVFQSTISHGRVKKNEIVQHDLSPVDENLRKILLPHQMDAVNFVISIHGRALIADEMGLGKTLEALASASYYVKEWPLLIISPANVRKTWEKAIEKFFSPAYMSPHNVYSPKNNREVRESLNFTSKSPAIVIISYDLMKTNVAEILHKKFRAVIVDESHLIKNSKSERYKATVKVLNQATRVMLLSGTPALSRPVELFTQLQCINRQVFGNYDDFVQRYCNAAQRPAQFGGGVDASGASNLEELEILLKETVMIRRQKNDVTNQMKDKNRTKVVFKRFLLDTSDETLDSAKRKFFDESLSPKEKKKALMNYFTATSKAKTKCVVNHVLSILRNSERKMVVFAHHKSMMDDLEKLITGQGYQIVKIDGSTPSENRQRICDQFQNDIQIRLALLSITAANTGITLTAANLVVFCELYWNPGVLLQAEDRVHRHGQEAVVDVHYLVAEKTADDEIWNLIEAKMDLLGKGGLMPQETFKNMAKFDVSKQGQEMIVKRAKLVLDDWWPDITDDVQINDDSVGKTSCQKKLNQVEIVPKNSLERRNSVKIIDFYPKNSDKSILPPLKISDTKPSIDGCFDDPILDCIMIKMWDELFDSATSSPSKNEPPINFIAEKSIESISDSSTIIQCSDSLLKFGKIDDDCVKKAPCLKKIMKRILREREGNVMKLRKLKKNILQQLGVEGDENILKFCSKIDSKIAKHQAVFILDGKRVRLNEEKH